MSYLLNNTQRKREKIKIKTIALRKKIRYGKGSFG